MSVGGSFPGTGGFMAHSTDQLRKDNALSDIRLTREEEENKILRVPERLAKPADPADAATNE